MFEGYATIYFLQLGISFGLNGGLVLSGRFGIFFELGCYCCSR